MIEKTFFENLQVMTNQLSEARVENPNEGFLSRIGSKVGFGSNSSSLQR